MYILYISCAIWIDNDCIIHALIFIRYCTEVVKISTDIVSIGLEEEKKRTRERELFQSAYQKALELNQKSSSELVQKYEEEKTKVSGEI